VDDNGPPPDAGESDAQLSGSTVRSRAAARSESGSVSSRAQSRASSNQRREKAATPQVRGVTLGSEVRPGPSSVSPRGSASGSLPLPPRALTPARFPEQGESGNRSSGGSSGRRAGRRRRRRGEATPTPTQTSTTIESESTSSSTTSSRVRRAGGGHRRTGPGRSRDLFTQPSSELGEPLTTGDVPGTSQEESGSSYFTQEEESTRPHFVGSSEISEPDVDTQESGPQYSSGPGTPRVTDEDVIKSELSPSSTDATLGWLPPNLMDPTSINFPDPIDSSSVAAKGSHGRVGRQEGRAGDEAQPLTDSSSSGRKGRAGVAREKGQFLTDSSSSRRKRRAGIAVKRAQNGTDSSASWAKADDEVHGPPLRSSHRLRMPRPPGELRALQSQDRLLSGGEEVGRYSGGLRQSLNGLEEEEEEGPPAPLELGPVRKAPSLDDEEEDSHAPFELGPVRKAPSLDEEEEEEEPPPHRSGDSGRDFGQLPPARATPQVESDPTSNGEDLPGSRSIAVRPPPAKSRSSQKSGNAPGSGTADQVSDHSDSPREPSGERPFRNPNRTAPAAGGELDRSDSSGSSRRSRGSRRSGQIARSPPSDHPRASRRSGRSGHSSENDGAPNDGRDQSGGSRGAGRAVLPIGGEELLDGSSELESLRVGSHSPGDSGEDDRVRDPGLDPSQSALRREPPILDHETRSNESSQLGSPRSGSGPQRRSKKDAGPFGDFEQSYASESPSRVLSGDVPTPGSRPSDELVMGEDISDGKSRSHISAVSPGSRGRSTGADTYSGYAPDTIRSSSPHTEDYPIRSVTHEEDTGDFRPRSSLSGKVDPQERQRPRPPEATSPKRSPPGPLAPTAVELTDSQYEQTAESQSLRSDTYPV
jgi:hypothetical protein